MHDLDLITEIHTDVKHLLKSMDTMSVDFKAHVAADNGRFKPLEDDQQQRKGAARMAGVLYGIVGGSIVWAADIFLRIVK